MHWRIFIYPLGLLRVLQTILGILAIVCTVKYGGQISIKFKCPEVINVTKAHDSSLMEIITWHYPYDLINEPKIAVIHCNETVDSPQDLEQFFFISLKVEAQFYVFVSVINIVICFVWILIYLFRWPSYEADPRLPLMDCTGAVALTALWVISTSSWYTAVSVMKSYLTEKSILNSFPYCQCGLKVNNCSSLDYKDNFSSLNFSLICGAVAFVLWLVGTFLTYRKVRRLKSENERYQYGTATVADAFSSSTTTPNILH